MGQVDIARAVDLAAVQDAVDDVVGDVAALAAQKGVANGIATLGADGLVPATQLPAAPGGGGGADTTYVDQKVATEATARADADDLRQLLSEKGAANGYAELGADGKVPAEQLPAPPAPPAPGVSQSYVDDADDLRQLLSEKGVANGYAGLGADGKVPAAQLPPVLAGSGRDRGSGVALPTTDLRRGDLYYHTAGYVLMVYTGVRWEQTNWALLPNADAKGVLEFEHPELLTPGFRAHQVDIGVDWRWEGVQWRYQAGPVTSVLDPDRPSGYAAAANWTVESLELAAMGNGAAYVKVRAARAGSALAVPADGNVVDSMICSLGPGWISWSDQAPLTTVVAGRMAMGNIDYNGDVRLVAVSSGVATIAVGEVIEIGGLYQLADPAGPLY